MPKILESIQSIGNRVILRLIFGGGLASAINPAEVDVRECAKGQNFALDLDEINFRPRASFDLTATATNAQQINGFVNLVDSAGTSTVLVQAGGNVYSWNGASTFTLVGTANASSKLRGGPHSTSLLDDKVVITDLAKLTVVKEWDGTTYQSLTHNLGGDLFAKYAMIENERMWLANIKSGSTDTPHVALASKRGTTVSASDFGTLSTSVRASGAGAAADDAFYIPMPDLRAINGMLQLFEQPVFSTDEGRIYKLIGADTTDYELNYLYPGSAAAGDEAIISMGDDALFGRPGIIETLLASEQFGNISTDDASRWIAKEIEEFKSWTMVFNPRTQRAYVWPTDASALYVFHKPLYDPIQRITRTANDPGGKLALSPWSKWITDFGADDFRQTAAAVIRRPTDNLDVVVFGDSVGRIFTLEGTGIQDGGSADIVSKRTSGLIQLPTGEAYDIKGHIKYKRLAGFTVTINFLFGGTTAFDHTQTIVIDAPTGYPVYGGAFYYGGTVYYGQQFADRILSQNIGPPGQARNLQVEVQVTGADFAIQEIFIEFTAVPG